MRSQDAIESRRISWSKSLLKWTDWKGKKPGEIVCMSESESFYRDASGYWRLKSRRKIMRRLS